MATDIVLGSELGPEFDKGVAVANQVTIRVDGTGVVRDSVTGELSSPAPVLTYTNGTQTLNWNDGQGTTLAVDLSALAADIFVNGGSYDANTTVLTLTDNDAGTPDVQINLGALLGPSTDAGNLLTSGADNKPFINAAAVTALATENCTSLFGTALFKAFAP